MENHLSISIPYRRPKLQVTVYTTPSCPQCEMTKKVLTKAEISYDVVDLSSNSEAMEYVTKELGYSAAPVVVAGQHHWSGFRHGALQNLIAIIHGDEAKDKTQAPKESVAA